MLTTGSSELDRAYKESYAIKSSHKVIAEWNQNAYTTTWKSGSYPDYINPGSTEAGYPEYVKTFNESEDVGGWDNGGYFLTITRGPNQETPVEHKDKKEMANLREIFGPSRPDPGIVYGFALPHANNSIIEDCKTSRAYNLLDANQRLYPLNKSQTFKYWTSSRYNKGNQALQIQRRYIGVADVDGKMKGNNVFVTYDDQIETNKIVIKTQTANGFAQDYTVEALLPLSENRYEWKVIYRENDSTRDTNDQTIPSLLDGTVRLTGKNINGNFVWSVAQGVETENAISDFNLVGDDEWQVIEGLRLSVQKLSVVSGDEYVPYYGGTLDIIELSPRLVIDLSGYSSSFNVSTTIGDATLGLPTGSIVSSTGSLELFNSNNMISGKNPYSLLYGRLKPNVKITFLNVIKNEAETEIAYVPIKVMYTTSWDEVTDWTVNVQLEDYMKFLRDAISPDILIGSTDGIKVSAIIKILLDNAGFTRYTFRKTSNEPEHAHEDRRIDFFYCSKESSLADTLNEIATSMQLSIFFDNTNTLVVMTKEAVAQKRSDNAYNYWIVGDMNELKPQDPEKEFIYNEELNKYNYISNIESFEDSVIPPITTGDITYQNLGINKESYYLVKEQIKTADKGDPTITLSDYLDSGYSAVTLNRDISYKPDLLWKPAPNDLESYLSCGLLVKDISGADAFDDIEESDILSDIQATDEYDAIRKIYYEIPNRSGIEIVLSEADLSVAFSKKYNGYVYIDNEMIKYNGIVYLVDRPGYALAKKLYFSEQELKSDKAEAPNNSWFIPYCLLVDIDVRVKDSPSIESGVEYYSYYCNGNGRAFNGTAKAPHYSGSSAESSWNKFSGRMYSAKSSQPSEVFATLNLLQDTKVTSNRDALTSNNHLFIAPGYAKLIGPPSSKTGTSDSTVEQNQLLFDDIGQEYYTGVKKSCGFVPNRIGTRMRIINQTEIIDGKETKGSESFIGGISMFLSAIPGTPFAQSGYFIEVSTVSEGFDPANPITGNIRVYKIKNQDPLNPIALGYGASKIASTTNESSSLPLIATSMSDETWRTTFDLDVITYMNGTSRIIEVLIEGVRVVTATDTSPSDIVQTQDIGMFVRDDTEIIYENMYATAVPNGVTLELDNPVFSTGRKVDLLDAIHRGYMSSSATNIIGTDYPFFYEDFGNLVREVRKVETRFNYPAFTTKLIDLSKVAPDYLIRDYNSTSFGASFWIYNTSRTSITISGNSSIPVFISGIPISKLSEGVIKIEDYFESIDFNEIINDELTINKNLYGQQSINISGPYINNYQEAKSLASWVAKKSSKEKVSISATIFPNPLLQLGDIVKVFYKSRGYSIEGMGTDNSYVISEIIYSVNDSGINMSLGLREML
jgi:hypothetical protein